MYWNDQDPTFFVKYVLIITAPTSIIYIDASSKQSYLHYTKIMQVWCENIFLVAMSQHLLRKTIYLHRPSNWRQMQSPDIIWKHLRNRMNTFFIIYFPETFHSTSWIIHEAFSLYLVAMAYSLNGLSLHRYWGIL